MPSLKEESKCNYQAAEKPSLEQLQVGCLQRIADATEKMAVNYDRMQQQLDSYKRICVERAERIEALSKSNAALRGAITKLKKKQS